MPAKVVHCKKEPYDVYIGRPSKWGNPFNICPKRTRERAIAEFKHWILGDDYDAQCLRAHHPNPPTVKEIKAALKGKVLGCWCAPQACHGDILLEIANAE